MKTIKLLNQIAKLEELERAKMNVWGDELKAIELKQENIKAGIRKVVSEMFPELTEKVEGKTTNYKDDFYIWTVSEMLENHKDGIVFIRNTGIDYYYKAEQKQTFDYYMAQVKHDHAEKRHFITNKIERPAKPTNRTRKSDYIHMYKLENGVPVKRLSMDQVYKEFDKLPTMAEIEKKLNKNKELVTA